MKEGFEKAKEVGKLFGDWKEDIKEVLAEKTRQKKALDHEILLKNVELSKLQEACVRQDNEFEQKHREKTAAFEQEKITKLNAITTREHQLDHAQMEANKRLEEVAKREMSVKNLEDEKHKLSVDRIDVEKLMVKGNELVRQGTSQLEIADEKLNVSATKEAQAKKDMTRVNSLEDSLITLQDKVETEGKRVDAEKKNIEKIRKELMPRMEELEKLEKSIDTKTQKMDKKTKDLNDKISEEKSYMHEVSGEREKLEGLKRQLNQREEAIKRREVTLAIK